MPVVRLQRLPYEFAELGGCFVTHARQKDREFLAADARQKFRALAKTAHQGCAFA
jgi:hypothetical protein